MFPTSVENAVQAFREIEPPAGVAGMGARGLSRGARLPRFVAPRADAGEALSRLGVVVTGVGAIGRNVAIHLARLMVGRLWIVDPGSYKPESLLTQAIAPDDVGRSKARSTARLCKSISPSTRVFSFAGPVQSLDATVTADADLVVMATDNLLAEVELGQRCLHLQQPLVQASVHGDTLTAQVRFFTNRGNDAACPVCSYNESEFAALNAQTTYSCDGGPDGPPIARISTPPTMSVGFLCSLAADLALVQILRFAAGLGPGAADSVVEYCGYTHGMVETPLVKRPDCPAEHTPWTRMEPPRPLSECSLLDLAAVAGLGRREDVLEQATFVVDELAYVEHGLCAKGHQATLGRFVRHGRVLEGCATCGGALSVEPFFSHRPSAAGVVAPVIDRPLREVAEAAPGWVVLRVGDRGFLFRSNGERESRPEAKGGPET